LRAAIVTIGDEILIGQITDTNSGWIAQQLSSLGIQISEMLSISDSKEHIQMTLDRLIGKVDLILMTGGLGPTKDDITKHVLTEYFGGSLVENQEILSKIKAFFASRGRTMIESNVQQALVPDNCKILTNNFGTAPGMWFKKESTSIISMPGVPYEMKPMVSNQLIPLLKETNIVPELFHQTIMTQGIPESYLAAILEKWENALPECIKLAYLPRPGIVRLRLSVIGECAGKAKDLLKEQIEYLKNKIGDNIFSYEDMPIEKVIGDLLLESRLTVSSAESCTGGNIARLLTSISGSSRYYKGSIIAYDNDVKEKQLHIDPSIIKEFGAVSSEVVEAMAKGVMGLIGSDLSMATSGIAGPDGGTEDKLVGTVWIAVASKEQVFNRKFNFGGHRELIIEQASIMAIALLRKMILGKSIN
jgi:nicotinamide-nucleotide amidase